MLEMRGRFSLETAGEDCREVHRVVGMPTRQDSDKMSVAYNVAQLGGLVPRVQRYGDATEQGYAEHSFGKLHAIGYQ
ncbi:hypothetical protein L485_11475 [Sphingobium baderi LL03]|uniref:Uncharacterized protein n=1 Tax=Sphingobium baderi LL03 TaxID=1114964 RepID=T0GJZ2_9SPHN|nr:hypothetical protein L485_11475 [Sphingobium baderi LL03]